jgi:hypothetical protein
MASPAAHPIRREQWHGMGTTSHTSTSSVRPGSYKSPPVPCIPILVEAITLLVTLVAPFLHEAARIVVRTALASIVNDVAVSEQRPVVLVEGRHLVEGQVMRQPCRGIGRIVRAAAQIDDFESGDSLLQPHGAGRIRVGSNQAPSHAQAPTAILAAELVQTCVAMSRAVLPAMVPYTPPSAVGMAPSTTAMYSPL